jgi:hypothetical protein
MENVTTPASIEREHTIGTAVARYIELRDRELLAAAAADMTASSTPGPRPLSRQEALELLALSETIARKALYGQQLSVRSARLAGASWSQIGAALGTSKQSAWDAHTRWINRQSEQHGRKDYEGMNDQEAAAARDLAGEVDEDPPTF